MLFGATGLLSMEEQELLVLDDRSSDDGRAQNGAGWRLFTDGVMGGVVELHVKLTQVLH